MEVSALQEVCPNCGSYAQLLDDSGWCHACSNTHSINNGKCIECGADVPESHERKLCWNCKEEKWLVRYGDIIEFVMLGGVSFSKARQIVADAIRPICVICGGTINGGTPGESLFCSNTVQCKRARNKYRRLIADNTPPKLALELVL